MENEKLQDSDIKITLKNPFLKWLENFWYHHKWKVIIITFFLIVIVVGVVQMVGKEKYDIGVTIATNTIFYTENVDKAENALASLLPEDMNGDGKKNVQLNLYKIYSEDEMKAANEKETDSEGNPIIYVDESYNKDQISQFNSYLMTGECTVMIVSKYMYDDLVSRRAEDILLKPVSEIYGDKLPEGTTTDGYGVVLSKTGAYKNLSAFDWIPGDSVVCIMRPFTFSKGANEEQYAKAIEYFKNIVEFGR